MHECIGDGRVVSPAAVEPRTRPAPHSETRNSVHKHISLKPSGFPFLRVTL